MAITTAATFCATLVDEWARAGVTDVVVCPGSRSTPLAVALASDPRIAVHVHHDERSGAFIALGIGLATGRAAVVLTSSGTAAVELHPAIVEAHQSGVPLIAATADRPPELQGVAAPQTIDQQRLYGGSVRWFVDAGVPSEETRGAWRSLAARAVAEALGAGGRGPGPVHAEPAVPRSARRRAGPAAGWPTRWAALAHGGRRANRARRRCRRRARNGARRGAGRDRRGTRRGRRCGPWPRGTARMARARRPPVRRARAGPHDGRRVRLDASPRAVRARSSSGGRAPSRRATCVEGAGAVVGGVRCSRGRGASAGRVDRS